MSQYAPVGGKFLTRPMKLFLAIATVGLAVVVWRFAVGLGPVTGLSDGYPFGLWIAFDVVTGTALACGGYAVAILVYVFNKGKYHTLVRPAILTSALGYSLAGLAIIIDVGRPWWIWKVPIFANRWNLNSALLEVALCVMAYILVLWMELSPAFLEKWEEADSEKLARFAKKARPVVDKALLWIIALGLLLPTMHQSSLGTVMLLAGPKLHPLWNTPMVPLLFLISCVAMGYGMVVLESTLAARFFGRKAETGMLASLSKAAVVTLALYLVVRLADLGVSGDFGMTLEATSHAFWFWLEIALVAVPMLMLMIRRRDLTNLFQASLLVILGGTVYRFVTYLIAYNPGDNWSYVPTVPELFVTLGIVSGEILLYVWIVRRFPILGGQESEPRVATARA